MKNSTNKKKYYEDYLSNFNDKKLSINLENYLERLNQLKSRKY